MPQTDQDAWDKFYAIYWKLVYKVALQAGLNHADAQEVVQNTFVKVAKNIQDFDYDPVKGKFRNWLCLIAKQQAINLFRRSEPQSKGLDLEVRQLPDKANNWDRIWDEEEKKHLLAIVLTRVRDKLKPKQYEIFHGHCIKGMGVKEVAELQGVTPNDVYVTKHRVMPIFEEALKRAQQSEE